MCSCPDDLDGKGRCRHVLGVAQIIYDDHEGRIKMVDMDGLSVGGTDEIKKNLEKIPALPDETRQKLVNYFKSFDM